MSIQKNDANPILNSLNMIKNITLDIYNLEIELERKKSRRDEIIKILINECNHEYIIEEIEHDGHTYNHSYLCKICQCDLPHKLITYNDPRIKEYRHRPI